MVLGTVDHSLIEYTKFINFIQLRDTLKVKQKKVLRYNEKMI